jgi:hypothetical protein
MKLVSKVLLLNILLFINHTTFSQTVSGSWYGVGMIEINGSFDNYLSELTLQQKGKVVKGEFNYYFRDSLFTNKIEGSFDAVTRKLYIKPVTIIFYGSSSTKYGVDCKMIGDFTLRTSRTETVLAGNFISDEEHKYTTPSLNLKFKKSVDTVVAEKVVVEKEKPKEEEAIAVATIVIIPELQKEFERREKTLVNVIEVSSSVINLELYDNGSIDNDSVSLFVNNKLVLPKTMLSHKAIELSITLDSTLEYTEISMFADNLGLMPPNTAVLILYDGKTRHELQMKSDLNKTATIRLKKKKT